jgi:hypothetical protein
LDPAADRAALCGSGSANLQCHPRTEFHSAWWKQILYIAGGLVLMWMVIPGRIITLLHHVRSMYIISVVALLGTYAVGPAGFRFAPLDSHSAYGGFTCRYRNL